jgi:hypothetical protein
MQFCTLVVLVSFLFLMKYDSGESRHTFFEASPI